MRKLLIAATVAAAPLLIGTTALAQSSPSEPVSSPLEKAVAYVQPSVVYLDITWTGWVWDKAKPPSYMNNSKPFTLGYSCTGFFVNETGYIATAGHCVDPANVSSNFFDAAAVWAANCKCYYSDHTLSAQTIRSFSDDWRVEGANKGASGRYTPGGDLAIQAVWSTSSTEPLYDSNGGLNGQPYEARVDKFLPWNDGSGDVAVLKAEIGDQSVLPIDIDEASTGQEIVSVGYPAVVGEVSDSNLSDPSFKSGTISSIRSNATYPVYEISAPMSGGMSGGPTVDLNGTVVGVNSYGNVEGNSVFEFVQSSQTLDSLLTDAGVENELGEVSTAYRAGLDAYFAGNKFIAVKNLQQAIALNPDFDMAQEYLTRAQGLPNPVPESSGFPLIPVGVGLAVLVALAGGGVLLLRNKRPSMDTAGVSSFGTSPVVSPASVSPAATTSPEEHDGVQTVETTTKPLPHSADTEREFCDQCGTQYAAAASQFCRKCGARRESEHG